MNRFIWVEYGAYIEEIDFLEELLFMVFEFSDHSLDKPRVGEAVVQSFLLTTVFIILQSHIILVLPVLIVPNPWTLQ